MDKFLCSISINPIKVSPILVLPFVGNLWVKSHFQKFSMFISPWLTGRQEVVLLDSEISFNEAIIEEREQGIQEIQHQIGEVNEIFKDLAVLVHEQGTMIGK